MRSVSAVPSISPSSYTVLIVDQVSSDRERYCRSLLEDTSCRYICLHSDSAAAAILQCQNNQVDGILVDYSLPDGTGLEFMQRLLSQFDGGHPPVVMVAGESDPAIVVRAMKLGVEDYLSKQTLTSEQLRVSMKSAIENARLRLQLQHQEERFRISVENMLDCFGSFSAIRDQSGQIVDFRIDYLNKAACENNRMPREMQIGRRLCELLPAHRETGLFEEYCRVVETGEPLVKESLVYDDDYAGQRLVRAYDIHVTKLDDGFVASWRDVTHRKQLELELNQKVVDLERQQHRLQRLIDHAPIGIGIGSADGEVKVANDAMLWLHGYTREEFEQQGMNWRNFIPPEFSSLADQAMERLQREGALPAEEKDLVWRDGLIMPIWVSVVQWLDGTDDHVAFAVDLTRQKQAQTKIEQLNRQLHDRVTELQTLIDTIPVGIAIAPDPDCQQMQHNAYLRELLGVKPGCNISKSAPDGEQPSFQVLQNGQEVAAEDLPIQMAARLGVDVRDIEIEIRLPDGTVRCLLCYATPLRDTQNQIRGAVGAFLDITDRKQAEQCLRENETTIQQQLAELENIYATAPVGLCFQDANTRFVRINDRLAEINGVSVADHLGRTIREVLPDLAETPEAIHRQVVETGEPILGIEIRGTTPAQPGVEQDWISSYLPLKDAEGRVLGVSVVVQDVTELRQTEAALSESHEQLANTLESITDAFIALDEEWRFTFVNPQAARLLRRTQAELIGKNMWQEFPEGVGTEFDRAYRQAIAEQMTVQIEEFYPPLDCWLELRIYPMRNGLAVYFQDVTARKAAQAQRDRLLAEAEAARQEAEASNRSKDEFVSLVAHELRSPLNAILGWATLLQTRSLNPEMTKQALETIARNTQRQVQLIEDLLDVSRIVRGTLRLEFAPVDLGNVVREAIATIQPTAVTKGLQLETQLNATSPIQGDFGRLQQVVLNLLTNAVKFTPEGGRIQVLLEQRDAQICIQVSDTGKGISSDFLPYVFERFRQDEQSTTAKQGLGLGLAIVHYIVEQHGGTITTASEGEGQGATFTVLLPLSENQEQSMGNEEAKVNPSSPPFLSSSADTPLSDVRVLLVDDNLDMLDLTALILEQAGAVVETTLNAATALQQFSAFRPDILISDIAMPEQDGYELLQQLRSRYPDSQIPAIALTAYASEAYREDSLRVGFVEHLTKPVEPDVLIAAIIRFLREAGNRYV